MSERPGSTASIIIGSSMLGLGVLILLFILSIASNAGQYFSLIMFFSAIIWGPLVAGGLALIAAGSGKIGRVKTVRVPAATPSPSTAQNGVAVPPNSPLPSPASIEPTEPSSSATSFCQNCGAGVGAGAKFCAACGSKLE